MAQQNFLVEGVSGTGKSSVCRELRSRGLFAVDGDNELAYRGDPYTGEPTEAFGHEYHVWDAARVREIAARPEPELAFFCGGSRNFSMFLDVFAEVFVLTVDASTLARRLAEREPDDWGGTVEQREQILRLHATQEDVPAGTLIDATRPLAEVVDAIVTLATSDAG